MLDPSQAPRPFNDPCKYPGPDQRLRPQTGCLKKHPAAPGRPFTCTACGKLPAAGQPERAPAQLRGPTMGCPGRGQHAGRQRPAVWRCGPLLHAAKRTSSAPHAAHRRRPFPCTGAAALPALQAPPATTARTQACDPSTCSVRQELHPAGPPPQAPAQPCGRRQAGGDSPCRRCPPRPRPLQRAPPPKDPWPPRTCVTDWTCGPECPGTHRPVGTSPEPCAAAQPSGPRRPRWQRVASPGRLGGWAACAKPRSPGGWSLEGNQIPICRNAHRSRRNSQTAQLHL